MVYFFSAFLCAFLLAVTIGRIKSEKIQNALMALLAIIAILILSLPITMIGYGHRMVEAEALGHRTLVGVEDVFLGIGPYLFSGGACGFLAWYEFLCADKKSFWKDIPTYQRIGIILLIALAPSIAMNFNNLISKVTSIETPFVSATFSQASGGAANPVMHSREKENTQQEASLAYLSSLTTVLKHRSDLLHIINSEIIPDILYKGKTYKDSNGEVKSEINRDIERINAEENHGSAKTIEKLGMELRKAFFSGKDYAELKIIYSIIASDIKEMVKKYDVCMDIVENSERSSCIAYVQDMESRIRDSFSAMEDKNKSYLEMIDCISRMKCGNRDNSITTYKEGWRISRSIYISGIAINSFLGETDSAITIGNLAIKIYSNDINIIFLHANILYSAERGFKESIPHYRNIYRFFVSLADAVARATPKYEDGGFSTNQIKYFENVRNRVKRSLPRIANRLAYFLASAVAANDVDLIVYKREAEDLSKELLDYLHDDRCHMYLDKCRLKIPRARGQEEILILDTYGYINLVFGGMAREPDKLRVRLAKRFFADAQDKFDLFFGKTQNGSRKRFLQERLTSHKRQADLLLAAW